MSSTLLCLVHFLYESSGFGDTLNKWDEVSESALCVYIHEFVYWTMHSTSVHTRRFHRNLSLSTYILISLRMARIVVAV